MRASGEKRKILNKGRTLKDDLQMTSRTKLDIKRALRSFREKHLFYLEHSKFATYADKDFVKAYVTVLETMDKTFRRLQEKSMASVNRHGAEVNASNRLFHSVEVGMVAALTARKNLLNDDLAHAIGLGHDLGHTNRGHDGEIDTSKYLQKYGIAFLHHGALATIQLEIGDVYNKAVEIYKQMKGIDKLTKKQEEQCRKTYIDIINGIIAHDGEGSENISKVREGQTEQSIWEDIVKCFTVKNYHRTIKPRTPEAAIVRFSDLVSYIPDDHRDAIIKGIVEANDTSYEEALIKLGIPEERLEEWRFDPKKKDKMHDAATMLLMQILAENSYGAKGAKIREDLAKAMYEYRELNYHNAVERSATRYDEIVTEKRNELMDRYTDLLIRRDSGKANVKQGGERRKKFRSSIDNQSNKVRRIHIEIMKQGTENFVINEIEDCIKEMRAPTKADGKKDYKREVDTLRRGRIEQELLALGIENETDEKKVEEIKKQCANQIITEMKLTYQQSLDYAEERRKENPEFTRVETYGECLSRFQTALYVAGMTNDTLDQAILEEGLLTREEMESAKKERKHMKRKTAMLYPTGKNNSTKKQGSPGNHGDDGNR